MRIADRLKILAIEAGASERQIKTQLADICGIKYQAVQQWFSSTNPSPDNIASIGKYYGSRLIWIITGEGQKYEKDSYSSDEVELISAYRSLPVDSKRLILTQFHALKPDPEKPAITLE